MVVVASYTVYILHFLISPDDDGNCRPRHVAHVMNKRAVEHLWCYIDRITMGFFYNFIKRTSDTIDLQ